MSADPTLVLSTDSSGSRDHGRCQGEIPSSTHVVRTDTVQQNAAQWPLLDDVTVSVQASGSGSQLFDTMAGAWTFVSLSPQTAQVALDAVRYQANYARTVTTRLCLHYVNSIRKRTSATGVTSFLYSVDGCTSSQIVETGRCDIYYCRPYTYELQLTQKAAGSDVYIVNSVYKTVDQKTLDELREDSNLDWSFDPTADAGTGADSLLKQAETPVQTEQPLAWQDGGDFLLQGSTFVADDEQPIAWTSDGDKLWDSQATTAQKVTAEPLSLRAEPLLEAPSKFVSDTTSGEAAVAAIGIVAVALAVVAFFLAIVMLRRRARRNAGRCGGNDEYSPLRRTLNTAEHTISLSCRDSTGGADSKPTMEKIELFG